MTTHHCDRKKNVIFSKIVCAGAHVCVCVCARMNDGMSNGIEAHERLVKPQHVKHE